MRAASANEVMRISVRVCWRETHIKRVKKTERERQDRQREAQRREFKICEKDKLMHKETDKCQTDGPISNILMCVNQFAAFPSDGPYHSSASTSSVYCSPLPHVNKSQSCTCSQSLFNSIQPWMHVCSFLLLIALPPG